MKKIQQKKEVDSTAADKLAAILKKYIDTTGAILDDYMVDKGAILELRSADENLKTDLEELVGGMQDNKFTNVVKALENMKPEDIEGDELVKFISEECIGETLVSLDYLVVKFNSSALRGKTENFIRDFVYPYYQDQETFIL